MLKMKNAATLVTLLAVLLTCSVAAAEIKLPSVIGSGMVLQQGAYCPIWGWAEPGEKIAVSYDNRSATTVTDDDGIWVVVLKDLKASADPKTMAIRSDKSEPVDLENVLVGEVWLCSGQSNMAWTVQRSNDAEAEIAAAKYPNIRMLQINRTAQADPKRDVPVWSHGWTAVTPETVPGFSAVAYFFGRKLNQELDTPIGLINSSWGGTPAERWTSRAAMDTIEGLKEAKGCDLYNGMIAPLVPFAIQGAIWYQGEANTPRAIQYRELLPTMIACWRASWGGRPFPFGIVQLAPYTYNNPGRNLPLLWESQLLTAKNTPNTGLVVTTDISTVGNIHPPNKQDVGARLGLWALATVYDKDVAYSGPIYKSMTVDGSKAVLSFDLVDGDLATSDGKAPSHFTIAGEDKKFVPATATIKGDKLIVTSDAVEKPVAVRFAWQETAEPNLTDESGLPASPFRTDEWEIVVTP